MKLKSTLVALVSTALLATGAAHAADLTPKTAAPSSRITDRQMVKSGSMKADREQVQQKVRAGKNRADYAKIRKDNGYRISAINEDKNGHLEYEVVKAGGSYEVQIDLDISTGIARKVDITSNLWEAGLTDLADRKKM